MARYNVSDRSVAYVRNRAATMMASNVSIYDNGENRMGLDGVVVYTMRNPLYTGSASIWETSTGATLVEGEAAITLMQTNISIPFGSYLPSKDDVIKVNSCPSDPSYVGRSFRVVAIDKSGRFGATIRMTVTSYADSAVWDA
jgi:hypothetical protein